MGYHIYFHKLYKLSVDILYSFLNPEKFEYIKKGQKNKSIKLHHHDENT